MEGVRVSDRHTSVRKAQKKPWDGTVGMLCDGCKSSKKNGGTCSGCPLYERDEQCERCWI
jgi:hypothetical protein